MSNLWGTFYSNSVTKEAIGKLGQEKAEDAINWLLQLHLDEMTLKQIEEMAKHRENQENQDETKKETQEKEKRKLANQVFNYSPACLEIKENKT